MTRSAWARKKSVKQIWVYWLDNNKALSFYFQFGRPLSYTAEIGLKQEKNIQGNSFFGRIFLKGMLFSWEKKINGKCIFFFCNKKTSMNYFLCSIPTNVPQIVRTNFKIAFERLPMWRSFTNSTGELPGNFQVIFSPSNLLIFSLNFLLTICFMVWRTKCLNNALRSAIKNTFY